MPVKLCTPGRTVTWSASHSTPDTIDQVLGSDTRLKASGVVPALSEGMGDALDQVVLDRRPELLVFGHTWPVAGR